MQHVSEDKCHLQREVIHCTLLFLQHNPLCNFHKPPFPQKSKNHNFDHSILYSQFLVLFHTYLMFHYSNTLNYILNIHFLNNVRSSLLGNSNHYYLYNIHLYIIDIDYSPLVLSSIMHIHHHYRGMYHLLKSKYHDILYTCHILVNHIHRMNIQNKEYYHNL